MTAMVDPSRANVSPIYTSDVDPVSDRVDVSVLVPAKDESENLPLFMEQAAEAFARDPSVRYEVVVIGRASCRERV